MDLRFGARLPPPQRLVIATRRSRLALWQAEHVRGLLKKLYPACQVELLGLTTTGDRVLDQSLSKIGGKGLFVKELEGAMADGRADLAVHSSKDVPMQLPEGFVLAAQLPRADPRDAFVSNHYTSLEALPAGGVIGTSSLRREAQLRARYPHIACEPLRGNLDTRLAKLDRGEFDALVLACAGLQRLGLAERIRTALDVTISVPAPGQGALAVECRGDAGEVAAWLAPLNDSRTEACIGAERALSLALNGSCQLPLAAYAEYVGSEIHMRGLVASPDGRQIVEASLVGAASDPEGIGHALADVLKQRGALEILAQLL